MTTTTGGKILCVDDDVAGLQLLETILADDFDLRVASTGEEAIAVAAEYRPDLVLLDVVLPDIDGYEACRRLRADPDLRHTKVVLVSGMSQTTDRLRGYELGADDFITKPYVPSELVAKVRVMLRLKHTEELSGLKDDILTLIAHETRTPLTVIDGAVDALRSMKSPDTAVIDQFVSMIAYASTRLGTLMERSHLLCALKSDSVPLERTRVDVYRFLASVADALADKAEARNVHIGVDRIGDSLQIDADRELLRVAVTAVTDNAIRFGPEGTTVRLGVAVHGETLAITIADEGPGFAAEVSRHLFEELATHGLSHHSKGARLGLAISREIARLHGGTIDIDSAPGNCVVSVRIPCASLSAASPPTLGRPAGG